MGLTHLKKSTAKKLPQTSSDSFIVYGLPLFYAFIKIKWVDIGTVGQWPLITLVLIWHKLFHLWSRYARWHEYWYLGCTVFHWNFFYIPRASSRNSVAHRGKIVQILRLDATSHLLLKTERAVQKLHLLKADIVLKADIASARLWVSALSYATNMRKIYVFFSKVQWNS